MSVESTVYSPRPAISLSQLIEAARGAEIELRAFDAHDDSSLRPAADAEAPLDDAWYVVVGWPRRHAETTQAVDEAIGRRDKPAIDRLAVEGKFGWCDLSCTRFDYEKSWERFPEERDEVEESYSPDELEQLRRAETKYFLRCGTRPAQNGNLLCKVAELIASATDGFLDVP
jgi:hypothetical protein